LDDALALGTRIPVQTNQLQSLNELIKPGDNLRFIHTVLDIAIIQKTTFSKEESDVLMAILRGDDDWEKIAHSIVIGSNNTI